jgi:hypothetical protein
MSEGHAAFGEDRLTGSARHVLSEPRACEERARKRKTRGSPELVSLNRTAGSIALNGSDPVNHERHDPRLGWHRM